MAGEQPPICIEPDCLADAKVTGRCRRHYQRQWARDNADKVRESRRKSRAKRPDHYRAQNARWFAERPGYGAERYARNREAEKERHAAYRAANRDKTREATRRWAEANRAKVRAKEEAYRLAHPEKRRQIEARRRARKRGGGVYSVTDRDVARLILRQRGVCAYCPAPLTDQYHLDHIVPLARGGHHAIGNLAVACPPCNSSKGQKTMTEWRMRSQRTHTNQNPERAPRGGALSS